MSRTLTEERMKRHAQVTEVNLPPGINLLSFDFAGGGGGRRQRTDRARCVLSLPQEYWHTVKIQLRKQRLSSQTSCTNGIVKAVVTGNPAGIENASIALGKRAAI